MFGLFKKRNQFLSAEELSRLSQAARAEVREKWLQFHHSVHLEAGVPLAQKIDLFAQPLAEFFQQHYPQLLLGGSEIFWLTTFTAILESGTHSKDEVNSAVVQLQAKYGSRR